MTRRIALALPLAALVAEFIDAAPPAGTPDPFKERHQMALTLLLMTDLAVTSPNKEFFNTYNSSTYPNTIFGKNGVDAGVYQAAQKAFPNATTRKALTDALVSMRTQMKLMGVSVENAAAIYDPADPCPYINGNGVSATVQKLTA